MAPWTVAYTYDADGKRASLVYPDGTEVAYAYTGRNQVASISADGPPPLATYTYDLAGNRVGKNLENNTAVVYGYDIASRLTGMAHSNGGGEFHAVTYALNAVSARTSRGEALMGGAVQTDAYTYDAIDQVTGVAYAGGVNAAYAYDAAGNRQYVTGAVPGTGSYATNSLNQYTAHNGDVLIYDNRGNLQQQGLGISFAYDSKNRLLSGSLGNHTLSMEYDYRNRVVKRTADGVATYLVYDGWSLIAEYNAAGQLQQQYVHGAAIDELLSKTDANGTVYYHQDGLGSTVALTNATGNLVERYTYDVFGAVKIFDASGLSLQTSAFGNRFFFTGREGNPQTGLYDYRNRVYSSSLGRFLQTDPIRFDAGDGNLYRYVGNKPSNYVDSFGLCENDYDLSDFLNQLKIFLNTVLNNIAFQHAPVPIPETFDALEGLYNITPGVIKNIQDYNQLIDGSYDPLPPPRPPEFIVTPPVVREGESGSGFQVPGAGPHFGTPFF